MKLPRLLLLATLFASFVGFVSAEEKAPAKPAAASDGDTVEVTFSYKPTRREGLRRVSLRNLAELLIRLWAADVLPPPDPDAPRPRPYA